MATRKPQEPIKNLPPPATTLEGREQQLTAAAYDLVEQRIANGSATSQETVHFLRVGSSVQQLQMAKLKGENELLKSRIVELEAKTSGEAIYAEALAAFKGYSGQVPVDPDGDEWDDDF